MNSSELLKNHESQETEHLPSELRINLERKVIELCGLKGEVTVNGANGFNEGLRMIVDTNEEIKELAREGKIDEAVDMALRKLIEEKGYGILRHQKEN